jgi:radical SAM superfamily enzyme YgiQ (UPF0313 family)
MPLLAAYTPPGVELHHTDEIVEPVDLDRDADLVALTYNTPAAAPAYRLAGQLRARGRRIVLGGPHVTALPTDALRHADALVIGEGELVWPDVVNDFARGRWQRIYRPRPANLRGMKAPRWDLIRGRRYGRAVTIAMRGCVHRCGYCSIPFLYGRGQRRRPVAEVAREVALMPGKSVIFWDDYLMADRALCALVMPRHRSLRQVVDHADDHTHSLRRGVDGGRRREWMQGSVRRAGDNLPTQPRPAGKTLQPGAFI